MNPTYVFRRLIIVLALAVSSAGSSPAQNRDPKAVVAIVNGEKITQADVNEVFEGIVGEKAKTATAENLAKVRAESEPAIIDQLINKKLLMKVASSKEVPEAEVAAAIAEIGKVLTPAKLKEMGWNDAKLRGEIVNDLKINKLIEERAALLPALTDSDFKAYYNSHIKEFVTPGYVKPRHILVSTDGTTGEELRKKRLQAERLRLKLNAAKGKNFAELAKVHSTCPSAKRGGELEKIGKGQMPEPFEVVAFKIPIGEVSSVVETDLGFHIIMVDERQEDSTLSLQDAASRIAQILLAQRKQKVMSDYVSVLKTRANIRRF